MADFRFYGRHRRWHAAGGHRLDWLREHGKIVEHVRQRIREEGPLLAADFKDIEGRRGPWWDWKPAKMALEAMYDAGELMIAERRGFQRVYDLAERVLPAGLDTTEPDTGECALWAVHRTLDNLGVADEGQMRIWFRDRALLHATLQGLLETGEIEPVEVRSAAGDPLYARAADLQATARSRAGRRVHLLSPFDNLVIRRRWLQRFFDFDYTIECYVPGPKRRYGYFCLPVLFGDRFVGRLDPKAERKDGVFVVRCLELEPDMQDVEALVPPLAESIWRFARFNSCRHVRVEAVRPAKYKMLLKRSLASTERG